MTRDRRPIVSVVAALLSACTNGSPARDASAAGGSPVRWSVAQIDTLLRHGREDQAERVAVTGPAAVQDTARMFALLRADSARSLWVRSAVARSGWPVRQIAGDSAMEAAWLILQHSPDNAWQASVLPEIVVLARSGELEKQDVALLTDRVLHDRKLSQRYGTQFDAQNGRLVPAPIEDLAGLDSRRASMGLPPMAVYVRKLSEAYGLPVDWPPTR